MFPFKCRTLDSSTRNASTPLLSSFPHSFNSLTNRPDAMPWINLSKKESLFLFSCSLYFSCRRGSSSSLSGLSLMKDHRGGSSLSGSLSLLVIRVRSATNKVTTSPAAVTRRCCKRFKISRTMPKRRKIILVTRSLWWG
jgi:hypothetical protein